MDAKLLRVYADTSVFGGCFAEQFREASRAFFDKVRAGQFTLVLSEVLLSELQPAPEHVRDVLTSLPPESLERVGESEAIEALRDAYVSAGVIGPSSVEDAEHVAAATIAEVDFLVSWNFKHIVHFDKISGYHGVNLLHGYPTIRIFSPPEVT